MYEIESQRRQVKTAFVTCSGVDFFGITLDMKTICSTAKIRIRQMLPMPLVEKNHPVISHLDKRQVGQ